MLRISHIHVQKFSEGVQPVRSKMMLEKEKRKGQKKKKKKKKKRKRKLCQKIETKEEGKKSGDIEHGCMLWQ